MQKVQPSLFECDKMSIAESYLSASYKDVYDNLPEEAKIIINDYCKYGREKGFAEGIKKRAWPSKN